MTTDNPQPPAFGPPPTAPGAPQPGGPRPRPVTVTAAVGLMLLQAVLSVVGIAMQFANKDILEEMQRRQAAKAKQDSPIDPETMANFTLIGSGVCGALLVILFVVLAFLLLRGSNAARITTWVVAGLFLLCSGIGAVFTVAIPDSGAPGWWTAYQGISAVLGLLIYGAIIVLLALPKSSAFFAKPHGQLY
jgi:hypothetical protein